MVGSPRADWNYIPRSTLDFASYHKQEHVTPRFSREISNSASLAVEKCDCDGKGDPRPNGRRRAGLSPTRGLSDVKQMH
jgi:hypothetical protein